MCLWLLLVWRDRMTLILPLSWLTDFSPLILAEIIWIQRCRVKCCPIISAFSLHRENGKGNLFLVITLVITADWSEEGNLDSLVKCQWFQWDEGNDCIAQRFAQGTQVLPILEINDHLCMEPVSWRILNSFKISGRHRKQIKCQRSLQESSDFVVQWLTSANRWHAWRVHSCQCASQGPGMAT